MRHGAIGYAVYFHCLELIAGDICETNITFELEHDAEIIADNLRIQGDATESGADKVSKIMAYIVELRLFDAIGTRLFCFKLLKRIDSSMLPSGSKMRGLIASAKKVCAKNHGIVMIESCETIQDNKIPDETRQDNNRQDEKTPEEKTPEAEDEIGANAQALFTIYYDKYKQEYNNQSPPIVWGKGIGILKNTLKVSTFEELKEVIDFVWKDPYIVNSGHALPLLIGEPSINKTRAAKRKEVNLGILNL